MRTLLVTLTLLSLFMIGTARARCGDNLREPDEACDDGNQYGGDGCASNCTLETRRSFALDPSQSGAYTQFSLFGFDLPLTGDISFTTGEPSRDNGEIPVVATTEDVNFEPIQVPSLACVCVTATEFPEFFDAGPGNVAKGSIGCGPDGLPLGNLVVEQDHNIGTVGTCQGGSNEGGACSTHADCLEGNCFTEAACLDNGGQVEGDTDPNPGTCNGPTELSFAVQQTPPGSMLVVDYLAVSFVFDGGTCCVGNQDPNCLDPEELKGPDGIPCTADDADPGDPLAVFLVTAQAETTIHDVDNRPGEDFGPGSDCGGVQCVAEVTGTPFDCEAIEQNPTGGFESGLLVSAFPLLNYSGFGDALVTLRLATFTDEPSCVGDCSGDGTVTVDELVSGVGIALGTGPLDACSSFDEDRSGTVEVNELVQAVNAALIGC